LASFILTETDRSCSGDYNKAGLSLSGCIQRDLGIGDDLDVANSKTLDETLADTLFQVGASDAGEPKSRSGDVAARNSIAIARFVDGFCNIGDGGLDTDTQWIRRAGSALAP